MSKFNQISPKVNKHFPSTFIFCNPHSRWTEIHIQVTTVYIQYDKEWCAWGLERTMSLDLTVPTNFVNYQGNFKIYKERSLLLLKHKLFFCFFMKRLESAVRAQKNWLTCAARFLWWAKTQLVPQQTSFYVPFSYNCVNYVSWLLIPFSLAFPFIVYFYCMYVLI